MATQTQYVPDLRHPDPSSIGVSGSQLLYYISDPNTEGLVPSDPQSPAQAATEDGSGPVYTWNITSQTWN